MTNEAYKPCKTIDAVAKQYSRRSGKLGTNYSIKITIDYGLDTETVHSLALINYDDNYFWRTSVLKELHRLGYAPLLDPSNAHKYFETAGIIARWYIFTKCTYKECVQWIRDCHDNIAQKAINQVWI